MTDEHNDETRERLERAWREYAHRLDTGQVQMGPGMPLLPPSYRGSGDFVAYVRVWVVRRGDELVSAFQKERDAHQWIAWAAAERGFPVEEFTVTPVSVMAKRKAGPLFDDLPAGPSQDGWPS